MVRGLLSRTQIPIQYSKRHRISNEALKGAFKVNFPNDKRVGEHVLLFAQFLLVYHVYSLITCCNAPYLLESLTHTTTVVIPTLRPALTDTTAVGKNKSKSVKKIRA